MNENLLNMEGLTIIPIFLTRPIIYPVNENEIVNKDQLLYYHVIEKYSHVDSVINLHDKSFTIHVPKRVMSDDMIDIHNFWIGEFYPYCYRDKNQELFCDIMLIGINDKHDVVQAIIAYSVTPDYYKKLDKTKIKKGNDDYIDLTFVATAFHEKQYCFDLAESFIDHNIKLSKFINMFCPHSTHIDVPCPNLKEEK